MEREALEGLLAMDEARFRSLFPEAMERRYAKGEPLWSAGDEPEAVCLVRSGRVNMAIQSVEGSNTVVHFCALGQVFCPAAGLREGPYPCSAVAAEDTLVLAAPRSSFARLVCRLPEFARGLLTQMSGQVCEAHRSQALRNAPVRQRLAGLLGTLSQRYSGRALPFTRRELADMSGTTVESTIRTLSCWEKSGVIRSHRGSIEVRRPDDLEEASA